MRKLSIWLTGLALIATACSSGSATNNASDSQTIRLITHGSFVISESVIHSFEQQSGHTVEIFKVGDTGTMLSQAILSADNPVGDVMFGVDNTYLGRALDADIFVSYVSDGLADVPNEFIADHRVTPIDFGDVCLNYDIDGLAERGIDPPSSLRDLTSNTYTGLLVVEHPGISSPGLAFMLATIAEFGEDGAYDWLDYWADLRANGVHVDSDWESAYYGSFSGGSGAGDRPIVVSYASSPPAEVFFSDPMPAEAPTGVIEAGCYRQIEYAGIVAGTNVQSAAEELIDFMLDLEFQEDIPLNMFVFPANRNAALPSVFIEFTSVPEDPAALPTATINANRDRWIEEWIEVVTG